MIDNDPLIKACQEALDEHNWPMVSALATALAELDIWAGTRALKLQGPPTDERTRMVPLIKPPARVEVPRKLSAPFGRAHCANCGALIAAYGFTRDKHDVTPYPGAPIRYIDGRADYTNWQHTTGAPVQDHDAVPEPMSIIGLLPPFADARPGDDGDTRDWPDQDVTRGPVCTCGEPITWLTGGDRSWWAHDDPFAPPHEPVLPA